MGWSEPEHGFWYKGFQGKNKIVLYKAKYNYVKNRNMGLLNKSAIEHDVLG